MSQSNKDIYKYTSRKFGGSEKAIHIFCSLILTVQQCQYLVSIHHLFTFYNPLSGPTINLVSSYLFSSLHNSGLWPESQYSRISFQLALLKKLNMTISQQLLNHQGMEAIKFWFLLTLVGHTVAIECWTTVDATGEGKLINLDNPQVRIY